LLVLPQGISFANKAFKQGVETEPIRLRNSEVGSIVTNYRVGWAIGPAEFYSVFRLTSQIKLNVLTKNTAICALVTGVSGQ